MKLCTKCGLTKELEEFHRYKRTKDGRAYRCILCDTVARKSYQSSQCPKRKREMARERLMRSRYGMELTDFDSMMEKCGGVCEICKGPPTTYHGYKTLCVDHCHKTGKVRGLLCNKCNQTLGLMKESIENMESAIKYLKERSDIH